MNTRFYNSSCQLNVHALSISLEQKQILLNSKPSEDFYLVISILLLLVLSVDDLFRVIKLLYLLFGMHLFIGIPIEIFARPISVKLGSPQVIYYSTSYLQSMLLMSCYMYLFYIQIYLLSFHIVVLMLFVVNYLIVLKIVRYS